MKTSVRLAWEGRSSFFLSPPKALSVMEKDYIINGKVYTVKSRYLPSDDLHEVSLVASDGEVWLECYGETRREAVREMEERLWDRGIKPGVPNTYIPWESLAPETRRKIQVYLRGLKTELLGEWMGDSDRFQAFQERAARWTSRTYGYTTPPTRADYDRL